jgi:neutral ceramidase
MLFLKCTESRTTDRRPIGALSWFPIHPTDRGQTNREVGGDNKGFASFLFEHATPPLSATERFVAAFANANCGDVSGNVEYGRRPNGIDDVEHMEKHARIEYFMATQLFESASEELVGSIDYRHKYVDMENVLLSSGPGGQTWRAALGSDRLISQIFR